MQKISLSIAIPMYNHEKTIHATLDSIFSQLDSIKDICDLEVVIIDDCSTDKSPEIIKNEYLTKYPDVLKYYKNEINNGISRNILNAIKLSSKEYVLWFGDDFMNKESLLTISRVIKDKEPDIICVGSSSYGDHNFQICLTSFIQRYNGQVIYDDNLGSYLKHTQYYSGFPLLKKSKIDKITDIDLFWLHPQTDILIQIGKNSKCMAFIDQELFRHYSYSRVDNVDYDLEYLASLTCGLLKKRGCFELWPFNIIDTRNNVVNNFRYFLIKDRKLAVELFFDCPLFPPFVCKVTKALYQIRFYNSSYFIMGMYYNSIWLYNNPMRILNLPVMVIKKILKVLGLFNFCKKIKKRIIG